MKAALLLGTHRPRTSCFPAPPLRSSPFASSLPPSEAPQSLPSAPLLLPLDCTPRRQGAHHHRRLPPGAAGLPAAGPCPCSMSPAGLPLGAGVGPPGAPLLLLLLLPFAFW